MKLSRVAIATAMLVASTPASAAGAVGELLWHTFDLAVLLGIVVYFARKPIRDLMATRKTQIEGDLDQARSDLEHAESQLAQWQQRMNSLDFELEEIRAAVRAQAEGERDRIVADAEASAARITANASTAVAQEARRARDTLRTESAELALERASNLIQERITGGERDRLFDEFLTRLRDLPDSDDADPASRPS